ncbi:DUF2262 domain-containing protein [Shewanella woodyi]|uniref:DUF2262 domain-containing protein n=1 Tax=Shewanella woodyi TaxID=60961 RepID=UPI0007F9540A|nr:DUF2262 domain-containing protein [Shewanella woodyi]
MNHSFFGEVEFSESLKLHTSSIKLEGLSLPVYISVTEGRVDLNSAAELMKELKNRFSTIYDYIEGEMYDLYRKEWAGFFKSSKRKFQQKINPNSIVIYSDQTLDIYFNDGGLFKGHDIVVRFSKEQGFFNQRLTG